MAAPNEPPITPVPLPPWARQVLVFGGTFDPPHAAHVELPVKVRDALLGPDAWVLFVPAARNPLKSPGPDASDLDRLNMLRLAIADRFGAEAASRIVTWHDEINRVLESPGPSYTADTVRRLQAAGTPGLEVRLLIGSDQAAIFHRWREARTLFDQTRPIVMLREPLASAAALQSALRASGFWSGTDLQAWSSRIAPTDVRDISSTQLRQLLHASPRDRQALCAVLPVPVLGYIERHDLYR